MTQTYPRLDYWLLFFCAIQAAWPEATDAQTVRAPGSKASEDAHQLKGTGT
jgi:hypothetical protein